MVDALIDRLGKPASEVLSELSMLEILGAVSMLPGGRVERQIRKFLEERNVISCDRGVAVQGEDPSENIWVPALQ